jgi:hypothetical protein
VAKTSSLVKNPAGLFWARMSRKQIDTPAKSNGPSIDNGSGNRQLVRVARDESLSVEVEFLEDTENRWEKIFQLLEESQCRSLKNT